MTKRVSVMLALIVAFGTVLAIAPNTGTAQAATENPPVISLSDHDTYNQYYSGGSCSRRDRDCDGIPNWRDPQPNRPSWWSNSWSWREGSGRYWDHEGREMMYTRGGSSRWRYLSQYGLVCTRYNASYLICYPPSY